MSKIPAITRTHVEKAILDIRRNGVPDIAELQATC